MDADDTPVGRILSRREAMALLASAGGAAALGGVGRQLLGSFLPSPAGISALRCIVRPEMTVGPYFLPEMLRRSDIRTEPTTGEARPGTPFDLTIGVARVDGTGCQPLPDAAVDIWQCDAEGVYSGFTDLAGAFDSRGLSFLRGYQLTDRQGAATFRTIFPGWYPGRSAHVHFKIRHKVSETQVYEFTSQLYFDERTAERIYATAPYKAPGEGYRTNAQDGPYRRGNGELLKIDVERRGEALAGAITIGLDLSDLRTGAADVWPT